MPKLNRPDTETIKLILRSPDRGDGWRSVSPAIWRALIVPFEHKELIEIDEPNRRIRLTIKGEAVAEYLP